MHPLKKKVTWLELFYDLIFVAAIASITHALVHIEGGIIPSDYILKFVLMFVPVWWAWVGQTLFINRYGQDTLQQRLFIMAQMVFVLIMTASLSVDFDKFYLSFLLGYIGLRILTAVQYLVVRSSSEISASSRAVAHYLGTRFWIGILISASSLFFEPALRYIILYAGILIDILVPVLGRRQLKSMPSGTEHLLERFGLFTIIVFGEAIVSTLAVLKPHTGDWYSIAFSLAAFLLIISMWWPYFEQLETKTDKSIASVGHAVIYGHLLLLLTLCMTAASIKLLSLPDMNYRFGLTLLYGSALFYFLSLKFVFFRYRSTPQRSTRAKGGWLTILLFLFFFFILYLFPVPKLVLLLSVSCVFFAHLLSSEG